jgi:Spy/CpxP family protein refolding chaperone
MKRLMLPAVLAGLALCLVSVGPVGAQEEGGRGRRGGGGFGFGGFGRIDKTMLLGSEQVRKEIKVTEEQGKKVDEVLASYRESSRELFGGGRGNQDASDEERAKMREERQKKTAELSKKTETKLAEVLDKKQVERLDQIVIQQQGADALVSENVIAALSLKPEQVEKIKATLAKRDEELRSLRGGRNRGQGGEGGGGQGGGGEEARAKLEKARKDTETAALAVLSSEQSEKFTKMKGAAFELDRQSLFRGRGGPGGGGGGRGGQGGEGAKKRPDADGEV